MDIRLKTQKDFDVCFKKGVKIYSSRLTLVFIKSETLKVGFAVSKKNGGSVIRNKIKRILRESFRSFMPNIKQNFFFVFIPKVNDNYDFFELKNNMEYLLKKAGAFND